MSTLKFAATIVVAGALSTMLAACGGGGATAKAPTGGRKVVHVEGKAAAADPTKLEKDDAEKKAVEAKVHVKEYKDITIKDNEVDLNPGITINFASSSDKINEGDESYAVLGEIWSYLSDNPDVKLRIEGNTDATGDAASNMDLSQRRAGRIWEFFVDAGIDSSRLSAVGCGQDNPLDPGTSAEAKAMNRRVEFIIVKDTSVVCGGVYDAPAGD